MDAMIYPGSLILVALIAFTFYQNNNAKLALLMVIIGVYIVYTHETGDSATDWKNEMVESLDTSAEDYTKSQGIKGYDAIKTGESLK